jgi:hypothetical protein
VGAGGPPARQIDTYGTAARVVGGIGLLTGAFLNGVDLLDAVLGLVVANAVVLVALAARGRSAPPLQWTGPIGHAANLAIVITAFSLGPVQVPAMLFAGLASLLAAARGMAACELFVVSNWLRRRDDRFGCPFYLCADLLDTQLTGTRAC